MSQHLNQLIEIRIATEYISKNNKALINRQIWGSDTYTSNSDAVAIMKHHGLLNDLSSIKLEDYEGVALFCRVTRPR